MPYIPPVAVLLRVKLADGHFLSNRVYPVVKVFLYLVFLFSKGYVVTVLSNVLQIFFIVVYATFSWRVRHKPRDPGRWSGRIGFSQVQYLQVKTWKVVRMSKNMLLKWVEPKQTLPKKRQRFGNRGLFALILPILCGTAPDHAGRDCGYPDGQLCRGSGGIRSVPGKSAE